MNALAELPLWASLPAAVLLMSGALLALLGSLGLLRLENFFARVHAPTLGSTLGAYCILGASMLVSSTLASRPVWLKATSVAAGLSPRRKVAGPVHLA